MEKLTFSVHEAAAALGISRTKAYEAIRAGQLQSIRLGRRVLIPSHALSEFLGRGPKESIRIEAKPLNPHHLIE